VVEGSSARIRNRDRRAALAKATALLQQFGVALRPLVAESEEPELATEGLGLWFNWIVEERERFTTVPRLGTDDGGRNDHAE
jgi:hypothetical protein